MNQWIKISYKPDWYFDSNYWDIWFGLNNKEHREKAPSFLDNDGDWEWFKAVCKPTGDSYTHSCSEES